MMTEEQSLTQMSNEFDILYNNVMSNKAAPLDEYEKSYFLTKAQYEILKNYLLPTHNVHQEGFDDSSKRQIDFSKIISVKKYGEYINKDVYAYNNDLTISFRLSDKVDELGIHGVHSGDVIEFSLSESNRKSGIASVSGTNNILDSRSYELYGKRLDATVPMYNSDESELKFGIDAYKSRITISSDFQSMVSGISDSVHGSAMYEIFNDNDSLADFIECFSTISVAFDVSMTPYEEIDRFDDRSILFKMPDNILFTLNEIAKVDGRVLNIVPISYGEYSTEISKPYKLPVKNQGWRLFQSCIGHSVPDLYSEVVIANPTRFEYYKIRYARRPRPIILIDLDENNGFDGSLSIDGCTGKSACELDQILFPEIVQRAVELARIAYGGDQLQQAQTNTMISTGTRTE